jgi:transcriptional regulator with XRE-family HTH domain
MNLVHVVAHNVRWLRSAHGWSQAQLGDEAGLHRTYVGQVERSEKSIGVENLGRIARALGVPPARLVTGPASVSVSEGPCSSVSPEPR